MPSFANVEVKVQADIDFEVFCGTCGAGLCNDCTTRISRNRGCPQVMVDACETCIENAFAEGRKEAEEEYAQQLWDLREAERCLLMQSKQQNNRKGE